MPTPRIEIPDSSSTTRPDKNASLLTAAKGGGIIFAGNLFQNGFRFVIAFLMARLLGAEQLGLTYLALSVIFITSKLALFGLRPAMVRYVSIYASRKDSAGLWGTLQIGIGVTSIASIAMGIGLFVLADTIVKQLFHEPDLAPLIRIISLLVPFMTLSTIIGAATQGFKRMDFEVISQQVVRPVSRLIMILTIAAIFGLTAKNALIAFSLATILAFVILLHFLNKLFTLKRPLRIARRDTRQVLQFALPIYLSDMIVTFRGQIQTLLLGILNTATDVGVFNVASQVNSIGLMFHSGIANASAPMVSELHDQGHKEQLNHFYQTVTKWTFTVNIPLFLIVVLFPEPILAVFGESFVGGATALSILAWATLANTGTGICHVVLDMTGNTTLKLINSLITFSLMLGLNFLFIPRWEVVGAAIASLIAVATVNLLILLEVLFLLRLFPYNLSFIKPIIAGLITVTIMQGINLLAPFGTDFFLLLINVMIIFIVYASMIFLLGLSEEDQIILNRVIKRTRSLLRP